MDAKGRIAMPAKHREDILALCQGRIVITLNFDRDAPCLLVFPEPQWDKLQADLQQLSSTNPAHMALKRILLGNAEPVEIDAAGRFHVSAELRDSVGLNNKDVVLAGMGNTLQLWDRARWVERNERDYDLLKLDASALPALSF